MSVRSGSGRTTIESWAAALPHGGSVVDVGAGSGEPLTSALIDAGLDVFAIDAAPSMVAAFRKRFPGVPVVCEAAEQSTFFGQTFDGVLAVGLVFLLPEERQYKLLQRLSAVLNPGGRLLFSAPHQLCTWTDLLTGRESRSLGAEAYQHCLATCGVQIIGQYTDEGETHYFDAQKQFGSC